MHIDNHRVITASWGQSQGDNALFVQGRWGVGGGGGGESIAKSWVSMISVGLGTCGPS